MKTAEEKCWLFSHIKYCIFADNEAVLGILRENQENGMAPVLFCRVRFLSHLHTNGLPVLDKVTTVITVQASAI